MAMARNILSCPSASVEKDALASFGLCWEKLSKELASQLLIEFEVSAEDSSQIIRAVDLPTLLKCEESLKEHFKHCTLHGSESLNQKAFSSDAYSSYEVPYERNHFINNEACREKDIDVDSSVMNYLMHKKKELFEELQNRNVNSSLFVNEESNILTIITNGSDLDLDKAQREFGDIYEDIMRNIVCEGTTVSDDDLYLPETEKIIDELAGKYDDVSISLDKATSSVLFAGPPDQAKEAKNDFRFWLLSTKKAVENLIQSRREKKSNATDLHRINEDLYGMDDLFEKNNFSKPAHSAAYNGDSFLDSWRFLIDGKEMTSPSDLAQASLLNEERNGINYRPFYKTDIVGALLDDDDDDVLHTDIDLDKELRIQRFGNVAQKSPWENNPSSSDDSDEETAKPSRKSDTRNQSNINSRAAEPLWQSNFQARSQSPQRFKQPKDGKVSKMLDTLSLPGYSTCGTICLVYIFNSGKDQKYGGYRGLSYESLLPDNKEGRQAADLLVRIFEDRKMFHLEVQEHGDMVIKVNPALMQKCKESDYPDPEYFNKLRKEFQRLNLI